MKLMEAILILLRRIYRIFTKKKHVITTDLSNQSASDKISELIKSQKPFMIARFGAVELNCIVAVTKGEESGFKKYFQYISGEISSYKLRDAVIQAAYRNAGVFPPSKEIISRFSKLMLNDINELDVLGSWLKFEGPYVKHLKKLTTIKLQDIEPYYHKEPWTKELENKTVLVIHPFTESIEMQYKKRDLLFKNPAILPNFTLKTIKSVQSIAGQKNLQYKDWFEALEGMKEQINHTEFDIALIGCGAYGFPLAAHVKRIGKQAIHIGGATQILFGVKGNRWEGHEVISKLFNEHWTKPNKSETPRNSEDVENACYW